jgi:hypothetical protein
VKAKLAQAYLSLEWKERRTLGKALPYVEHTFQLTNHCIFCLKTHRAAATMKRKRSHEVPDEDTSALEHLHK